MPIRCGIIVAMSWLAILEEFSPWFAGACHFIVAIGSSLHALLRKRDVRATIGWFVVIWLVPVAGPILYLVFGVNRIRRAARLARLRPRRGVRLPVAEPLRPDDVASRVDAPHLSKLVTLANAVCDRPLIPGNKLVSLENGEAAYGQMLEAIHGAERSVSLSTYIFEADKAGQPFVDALAAAVQRGVAVRVLVDAAGVRYGYPRIDRVLRKRGVSVERFMAAGRVRMWVYLNLRMHRKTLIVDGEVAFTGGMNIRHGHLLGAKPKFEVLDRHFRLEGPVVAQLQQVFAEDWEFTRGEVLDGPAWFPPLKAAGGAIARGIPDGPDEDLDKMLWTIQGAIACAEHRIVVMTPYFLPDQSLASALNVAAMRGVEVDIVIPHKTNIALAEWAAVAQLPHVLGRGCRVHRSSPPFEHSKLMIVDGAWAFFGSGNWDARSLRLNFELNVESYDTTLAATLETYVMSRIKAGREVTLEELRSLPLYAQIRNGFARLFMPYL